jgi:phage tail sheath gpL-like
MSKFIIFASGFDDPGVYIGTRPNPRQKGLAELPQSILVLGQKLDTGSRAALVLDQIYDDVTPEAYYGRGSMLAETIKIVRSVNKITPIYAMSVEDAGAGGAAVKTITFTGPATKAGILYGLIDGKSVWAAVAKDATVTQMAAAFAAAVTADGTLPFTAAAAEGVVTLTCKWKGETGNHVEIRFNYRPGELFPAGVGAAVATLTPGAGNPDILPALAAIGDRWFTRFVLPYTDAANLAVMKTEMERRFGYELMLDGQAFAWCPKGTVSETTALLGAIDAKNINIMGYENEPESPWIKAGRLAGEETAEGDPVIPRDGTVLAGMLPPELGKELTNAERRAIRAAGGATYTTSAAGVCAIEILRTTYKTNEAGVADKKNYQDIDSMNRLAGIRYTSRIRLATEFAKTNIVDSIEGVGPGVPVVDPGIIEATFVSLAIAWVRRGWIENLAAFKENFALERDPDAPGRVQAAINPHIVNVLRQIGVANDFTT